MLSVDTCWGGGEPPLYPAISRASEAPHPPSGFVSQPSGMHSQNHNCIRGQGKNHLHCLGKQAGQGTPRPPANQQKLGESTLSVSLRRTSPAETMTLHFWPQDSEGTNLPFKPLTLWDFVKVALATLGREAARLSY